MSFQLIDSPDSNIFILELLPDSSKAQLQLTQQPVPNLPYSVRAILVIHSIRYPNMHI